MNKVTESIFDGKNHVIPLAQVSYLEKDNREEYDGIKVIMKSSQYKMREGWGHVPYLQDEEKDNFVKIWNHYRYEVEGGKETFAGPED